MEARDGAPGDGTERAYEKICVARSAGGPLVAAMSGGTRDRTPAFEVRNVRGGELPRGLSCSVPPGILAKLAIVIEEADESAFWLELLVDAELIPERKLKDLKSEANQLVAIFNASRTTATKGSHSTINNQQFWTGSKHDFSESHLDRQRALPR